MASYKIFRISRWLIIKISPGWRPNQEWRLICMETVFDKQPIFTKLWFNIKVQAHKIFLLFKQFLAFMAWVVLQSQDFEACNMKNNSGSMGVPIDLHACFQISRIYEEKENQFLNWFWAYETCKDEIDYCTSISSHFYIRHIFLFLLEFCPHSSEQATVDTQFLTIGLSILSGHSKNRQ